MNEPFDLAGRLPAAGSTTVLQASAGTGKTFALAGLVTRYLAEGRARLDEMLMITFSRAATRELRERIRAQLVEAVAALNDPVSESPNELVEYLVCGTAADREHRRDLLHDALTDFDAATIATTHEFCGLVLKSLGIAGDTNAGVTLVESLDDLIDRIVGDFYLARFGPDPDEPALSYSDALALAHQVIDDPYAELRPTSPEPDSVTELRYRFADDVRAELELRKRRLGVLGYDDLLSRLAAALSADDSDAADRMRRRWPIVMVDEFQDTDRVQWQIIDRAFGGHCTVVLIGDPKQAIYGFRGGDLHTYLQAVRTTGEHRSLPVNWRSDAALVDALQVVLGGAALGHEEIVVDDVTAHHRGHRLTGAPHNAPFRLRVVPRGPFDTPEDKIILIDPLREHIPKDLAADIAALLAGSATLDGAPLGASDIAVLVEAGRDARLCQDALAAAGIAAVYTGDSDVLTSPAADAWQCLLAALEQPHRSGLVRAAAATVFFGHTAADLDVGGDALTDRVAATFRSWSQLLGEHGPAAVLEAAQMAGLGRRLLGEHGGERTMTDLAHLTQLLQTATQRDRLGVPALRQWLRRNRDGPNGGRQRNRRLDSDADAVQIMTVWGAKGLQFPIVYLPFVFNRNINKTNYTIPLFHDNDVRCRHVGGDSPDYGDIKELSMTETRRDHLRLTYVALTRAQSQVVAWWAPSQDEVNGGLSRLLRGRDIGEATVPDQCAPPSISDTDARAIFDKWQAAGGPAVEDSVIAPAPRLSRPTPPAGLAVRVFHRIIDTAWRRTSYSALVQRFEDSGVHTEPEVTAGDDETGDAVAETPGPGGSAAPSPMAGLRGGREFGSLVHEVLEHADPFAEDLRAELEEQVRAHHSRWRADADPAALATALMPMYDTPLGPLADGMTLRQIGRPDRLPEMGFEMPLAGGDAGNPAPDLRLADVGALLRQHLGAGDPFLAYADRLDSAELGGQSLRGYLSGSIDVVLRLPGPRYLVVDYKTNNLGDTAGGYALPWLTETMQHSNYALQALLYLAALHRFLRWRQPGYDPQRHLGGVLYLFVRGMCGANSPVVDDYPSGVFDWRPPPSLAVALSDLLQKGRSAP